MQIAGPDDKSLREVIAVYKAIFEARPDVNAALHTHSPHLTAYAIAHKPFPIRYWSVAKRAGVNEIPLAEWAPRYSAEPILDVIRAHPKAPPPCSRTAACSPGVRTASRRWAR